MINEVYFCLVFEGLKNKTKNQKRKDSAMMSLVQRVPAGAPGPTAGTLSPLREVFRQRSLPRCSFGFHEGLTLPALCPSGILLSVPLSSVSHFDVCWLI